MKIAAGIGRTSTGRQEKEATIESQISEIKDRIKKDGNVLGENLMFIDDGWSGDILARPGLDAMRDTAAKKQFEVLYVWDRDRIARKYSYQELILDELQELGIEVVDLQSAPIRNVEDKILLGFKGLFAEYEKAKIVERMRRGKMYKAKNGILFGWQAPYGYRYVKGKDKCTGYFEIVPHEAEIIKKIFTWIGKDGLTIRQTIKRLYEQNITPRESKRGCWSTGTLSRRLRDETYIGITYYNKSLSVIPENPLKNNKYKRIKKSSRRLKPKEEWHAIKVPAIIDKDLFNAVQRQLVINNQFCMRNKKHDYLLSNLIYCTCGCTRAGEGGNNAGQWYYRCTDRVRRFPLLKECNQKGVNSDVIDKVVWEKLSNLLTNPDLIKKQAKIWLEKQKSKSSDEAVDQAALEQQLTKLAEEEKRYIKAYGEGVIAFEKLKELTNEIKLKKTQLLSKINQDKDAALSPSYTVKLANLKELCDKMSFVLKDLTFDKKRIIVKKILRSVTTDGHTANIKGHIPLTVNELTDNQNVEFCSIHRHRRSTKRR